MKYEVTVTEQYEHCFDVEANSTDEAKERAHQLYEDRVAENQLPYSDHDFWIDDDRVCEIEEVVR